MARTKREAGAPLESRRGLMNEARWDEILEAAAVEFNERGYREARLQDIASRVGLLTGSLYYYIDSKEDLLFAILKSTMDLAQESLTEDDATAASDAATRLVAYIRRSMSIMDRLLAPAGGIERGAKALSPGRRAEVIEVNRNLIRFVRSIIEQGIRDGDFDADVDVSVATNSLMELLSTTRYWVRTDRTSYADVGDWYARITLRGLLRRDRLSQLPDGL